MAFSRELSLNLGTLPSKKGRVDVPTIANIGFVQHVDHSRCFWAMGCMEVRPQVRP